MEQDLMTWGAVALTFKALFFMSAHAVAFVAGIAAVAAPFVVAGWFFTKGRKDD